MSGLGRMVCKLLRLICRRISQKDFHPSTKERQYCHVCGTPIDYTCDSPGWYNIDISKGHCSYNPFCEIVICNKCVERSKDRCAQLIINLLE